jgi:hypothetical protein
VRYASIKALTRICKSLDTKDYDELRLTSWSCLVVYQETEINANVLEALKVGQVNSKVKNLLLDKKYSTTAQTVATAFVKVNDETKNIYCQMAINLFQKLVSMGEFNQSEHAHTMNTYRESNTTSTKPSQQQQHQHQPLLTNRSRPSQHHHHNKSNSKQTINNNENDESEAKSLKFENVPYGAPINSAHVPATNTNNSSTGNSNANKKRTTLKEEIIIHQQYKINVPDYFNRKNFDLMRIVEDQVGKPKRTQFNL